MWKRGIQIIDPQSALPSPKLETKCLGQFRFDRKCKCKFRRPKTYSTVSSVEMERERERAEGFAFEKEGNDEVCESGERRA